MLGYEKIEIKEDEFVINCLKTTQKIFKDNIELNSELEMLGRKLKLKEIKGDNFAQSHMHPFPVLFLQSDSLCVNRRELKVFFLQIPCSLY